MSQKTVWPVSNTKAEDAMFTISIDEDRQLFRAGESIKGFVYINFNDTGEELNLDSLKISLRQSISQPHLITPSKKNVVTNLITEQVLILKDDSENFSTFHHQLNQSLPLKVPFMIELPPPLASSYNSNDVTICYEVKAELVQLNLCGELCDLNVNLPVEVIEEPNVIKEPAAQLQEAINNNLMTFYASLKKTVFSTGESVAIEFYLDLNSSSPVLMNFQIQQVLCFADKRTETVIVKEFIGEFVSDPVTGILLSKYSFLLDDTIFTSQPSIHNSNHIKVKYLVSVLAQFKGQSYELFIPIIIERNDDGLFKRYLRVYSDQGLPLLPLTVTVKELKADGLQSYIPMKQCYENKRLTVKKGQVGGMKAILTIISESFKAYTSTDIIKGFVYLSFPDISDKVVFDKLLIVLVGACQYKNTGTIHRNGEMFLFKSQILHGNNDKKSSPVILKGPSSGIVVEFEFNLAKEKKLLPPSFNSDDVMVSYELKADVFNLQLNGKKASLYTRLPIVVHDNGKIPKSISQFSKKSYSVSVTLDKPAFKHKDNVDLTIHVENKTKKQLTVRILLVQQTENSKTGKILRYIEVSTPILLLVLPKSKIVSNEVIPLKDDIFHFQPTLSNCQMISVGYSLIIEVMSEKQELLNKHVNPIHIKRKYGFSSTELSCEGYPLLPLTLEYFSKDGDHSVPEFLQTYSDASMVKLISSGSCFEKWKGWKIK